MSADKRTVATDALEVLGTKWGGKRKVGRDAIHLAVEPVVAGYTLDPGGQIGFGPDGKVYYSGTFVQSQLIKYTGIVDPFLEEEIQQGEEFLMVIKPREITSLRHVWTHPDLPDTPEAADVVKVTSERLDLAVRRLTQFAESLDISLNTLMEGAKDFLDFDDYLHGGAEFESVDIPETFWDDYEVVTGTVVGEEQRGYFFSCSC